MKSKAFTLIELMIVIVILAIIGTVVFQMTSCTSDHEAALAAAKEVAKNYDDVKSVSCVNKDSDRDGYCSCTIYRENTDVNLECGCERWGWNKARGCKAAQYKVRGGTQTNVRNVLIK